MSRSDAGLYSHMIAGGTAGAICTTLCSPLDVAKTRIQAQGGVLACAKYNGIVKSLQVIHAEESLPGLYRGFSAAMLTIPTYYALYFPTYEIIKDQLQKHSPSMNGLILQGCAATLAGTAIDTLTYPLWFLRTRIQTQHLHQLSLSTTRDSYTNLTQTAKSIYRREGIFAFYKGLSAGLLAITGYAVQFPVYEYLKQNPNQEDRRTGSHPVRVIRAAIVSKVLASFISYPHDVVRVRLQDQIGTTKYRNAIDGLCKIGTQEGIQALYAGFQVNTLRTIPQCAITFFCYEYIQRKLQDE